MAGTDVAGTDVADGTEAIGGKVGTGAGGGK